MHVNLVDISSRKFLLRVSQSTIFDCISSRVFYYSNEYLVANFALETAENESLKVCQELGEI